MFKIRLTQEAKDQYDFLSVNKGLQKRFKAVQKTLQFLKHNPRHPSLQTHKFTSLKGLAGEDVFVSYAEQNTPAAYRVFWCYGQEKGYLTVLSITAHP